VKYHDYMNRFLAHRAVADVRTFASLSEGTSVYPLLRASTPGDRTLLITAGFHGDETAGPLTLVEHLPAIVEHAAARGVGLVVFPCLNPSGFVDNTRYNRTGESPNNDFLRYEVTPGHWVGELAAGQRFLRWRLHRDSPKETRALLGELERMETPHAALDIHQDPWLEGAWSYAYTFGPREVYRPMVDATEVVVPLAREVMVDDDDGVVTDANGLIEFHDGSVTDYLHRRNVPFTAALETTTQTDLARCHEVNLIWIRGFIDLAASGVVTRGRGAAAAGVR
jgi:hypothetical protein